MSKFRYVLALPFLLLSVAVFIMYAVIAITACFVGGQKAANFIHGLTESAIL